MNIKGPNGHIAKVSDSGQLQVNAVTQNLAEALNLSGLVFTITGTETAAGANDFFFYLKNIGTNDLGLSTFSASSSVPTEIQLHSVSGEPVYVSETAIIPTNLNLGSSVALPVISNRDSNITGITSNGIIVFEECAIADTRCDYDISSTVIIPQGKAIAFSRVAGTGAVKFSMGIGIIS